MDKELENSISIRVIFESFINDFIAKDKLDRILQFYANEKNWWKIKLEFHSSNVFGKHVLTEIKPNEQMAYFVYKKLKGLGASDNCYSILDYLDNKIFICPLKQKIEDSVGMLCETVIYCPDSKVGYFEGGHAKDRYILKFNK